MSASTSQSKARKRGGARGTRRDSWVDCDLDVVEREIVQAHMPVDETFKFICQPCHVVYDAGTIERSRRRRAGTRRTEGDGEFRKLGRIELWASRPLQANHQMISAFMDLESLGSVSIDALRRHCESHLGMGNFSGKYASMKTDAGNSYGKVFFDDGDQVQTWPLVRAEVERWF